MTSPRGFFDSLQLGAQMYSHAPSDEHSGCESCSAQRMNERAREDASVEFG